MVFLFFSIFILNLTAVIIPKRISRKEIYAAVLLAVFLIQISDMILDVKYNLYGYIKPGVDYLGIAAQLGLSPSSMVIFLNYFPYEKSLITKILYILGFSVLLIIFEWLSIKSGYFYHNGWTYMLSAVVYPLSLTIIVLNSYFVRRYI